MEQRRFLVFLTLSLVVLIGWTNFIVPRFFPAPVPPANQAEENEEENPQEPQVAANNQRKPLEAPRPNLEAAQNEDDQQVQQDKLPDVTAQTVLLGSLEPDSGYFMEVELTNLGGSVSTIKLNDPKFRDLNNRDLPLAILNPGPAEEPLTLAASVVEIDKHLKDKFKTSMREVHWTLVENSLKKDDSGFPYEVSFSLVPPGYPVKVVKTFRLHKLDASADELRRLRETATDGYLLDMDLTFQNLSPDEKQKLTYLLHGPVGLPLENLENTRKFRTVRMGFLEADGSVDNSSMTAEEVVENQEEANPEVWQSPIQYLGIDVQYFASLVHPIGDQLENPYIAVTRPVVIEQMNETEHSDISVLMESAPIVLNPRDAKGNSITHTYTLYSGPKRETLLDEPLSATAIMDYGWFGFISKMMLSILHFLHDNLWLPYGLAIIFLTIMVRGALFPLSRKQAVGAQKMKELKPELDAIRKKFANQKEKMAQAQMELFRKHKYNPFSGCLPIFLQLPIFFGLYSALNASVDLRMADFLWVDNLAAPDALFEFPFTLPFLGSTFNLLPIVTIVLFIIQQKMFMPPATTKEEELQHKMMNFMMIFMGFLFYRVPAGLCVYFIASSLWGIGERKLLEQYKQTSGDTPPGNSNVVTAKRPSPTGSGATTTKKKPRSRR